MLVSQFDHRHYRRKRAVYGISSEGLTAPLDFKADARFLNLYQMTPDQRIRDLCGQLLRAENISVIQTVAAQMKEAIDEYVASKDGEPPVLVGK